MALAKTVSLCKVSKADLKSKGYFLPLLMLQGSVFFLQVLYHFI